MTTIHPPGQRETALAASSAAVFGSRSIPSESIDRQFGMEIGKLRNRAGIRSVSQAAHDETEVSLGTRAASQALDLAGVAPDSCDWIFASSETHHTIPSLAAELHAQLRLRESCGAMDIGGACLGLLHALATAKAFVASGQARRVLIVTADVHSVRLLTNACAANLAGFSETVQPRSLYRVPRSQSLSELSLSANFSSAARLNLQKRSKSRIPRAGN
jgi:3-oxoacyl-[acyl-carrier-protein] synthase III